MAFITEYLYDMSILSVTLRLFLAVICGGIIGLERGTHRHHAGFRTHILVCVGATLAMLTNQFIFDNVGTGDPARIGAQVITGVGFLGVGTILITGHNRIKGLTTAAGLWASACLGLALGTGFYSGAFIATVVIFLSLSFLPKIEKYFYNKSRIINLYIEIADIEVYRNVCGYLEKKGEDFSGTGLLQTSPIKEGNLPFQITLKLPKGTEHRTVIEYLNELEGTYIVEEI